MFVHIFVTFVACAAPVLSQAFANLPLSGGVTVTVTGLNFGYSELTASSAVGGVLCGSSSWSSDTSVACEVGMSTSLSTTLEVTVGAAVGTGRDLFSYDGPVVSHSAHIGNIPLSYGGAVTVTGLNFGYSEYTSSGAIALGRCSTLSWNSGTTVVCKEPKFQSLLLSVHVTVGAIAGTGLQLRFSFDGMYTQGHSAARQGGLESMEQEG